MNTSNKDVIKTTQDVYHLRLYKNVFDRNNYIVLCITFLSRLRLFVAS